jgi:hypothetical protein
MVGCVFEGDGEMDGGDVVYCGGGMGGGDGFG